MGEVVRMQPKRTLRQIVDEILLDEGRMAHVMAAHFSGRPDAAAFGILERRLSANKAEARAMVEGLSGIDWAEIEAALS